jgi:hypothetical protein
MLYDPRHVFGETVSVDAWYEPFNEERTTADLRVDVTFRKDVPVGAEPESPVRFRLSLHRAEIVVILPDHGSIGIDRDSVAREMPDVSGQRTDKEATTQNLAAKAEAGIGSTTGFVAKASMEGSMSHTSASETEFKQNIKLMLVMHSATRDGHSWEIKPTSGDKLEGKPWDAVKEPRLKIIDKRTSRKRNFLKDIIIEVRCRREDLCITELKLKDEAKESARMFRKRNSNPEAAARGYIHARFATAGLDVDVGSIDEKFIKLVLSRISATPND